jgi:broad specificity phosphatase PhoE
MNIESPRTTRWWWIRHAPVPDIVNIYGQNDVDSDTSDADVFAALAHDLPRNAVWLTSNLKRTHQTANAILSAMAREDRIEGEPTQVPDFAEQHLGEWQGMNRAEFFAGRAHLNHPFWFGPSSERPPGGESFDDLVARVAPAIEKFSDEYLERDVIAIAHGGTIKAAISHALKLSPEAGLAFACDNCSVTRLERLSSGPESLWRVISINHRPWAGMEGIKTASALA